MTWAAQPCCSECWYASHDYLPVRLREEYRQRERCAWCGRETLSGIYLREESSKVNFPADHD